MSKIFVRQLIVDDAQQAAAIQVETWKDTYKGMIPSETLESMTLEYMIPMWTRLIGENSLKLNLLGVFEGTNLLGTVGSGVSREKNDYECELWAMNIPVRNQRRGLGRVLFQASVDMLRSSEYKSMYFYCIDKNENALHFYRSMGGRITDRIAIRNGYQELMVVWDSLLPPN